MSTNKVKFELYQEELKYIKESDHIKNYILSLSNHDSFESNSLPLVLNLEQAKNLNENILNEVDSQRYRKNREEEDYELTKKGKILEDLSYRILNEAIIPLEKNSTKSAENS